MRILSLLRKRIGVGRVRVRGARFSEEGLEIEVRPTWRQVPWAPPGPWRTSWIPIDGFRYRKRHHYATVVVDHERGRVVWAGEGRSAETLGAFFEAPPQVGERGLPLRGSPDGYLFLACGGIDPEPARP